MNKNELIEAVASAMNSTKAAAEAAINATFGTIQTQLSKGNKVTLVGFGSFSVQNRKATTGRNPRTGEKINIAAKKKAKFTPGKKLAEAVN